MALIAFIRGINVGGSRRFRPSVVARELAAYDVVNVGAAGTLIARKRVARSKFLAEVKEKLPFEAVIAWCDSRELVELEAEDAFGSEPLDSDLVRFVSILSGKSRAGVSVPLEVPSGAEWYVRVLGAKGRLVYGVYRRQMRTIGYLGRIDEIFGVKATTRSWNTIVTVLRILRG